MPNLQLHIDGPVQISKEDFEVYQNLKLPQHKTFEFLYYTWIDEHNSDSVRRLALRDMFNQSIINLNPAADKYYHHTDNLFSGLLHINSSNEKEQPRELYWQLHNRPKLLAEFVEEFGYMLNNHRLPVYGQREIQAQLKLIEIVMQLSDEEAGRKFLPYYQIWNEKRPIFTDATKLLNVWADSRNPAWLRGDLEKAIGRAIMVELVDLKVPSEDCSEYNLDYYAGSNRIVVVHAALDLVKDYIRNPKTKSFSVAVKLIDLMRRYLPENFCILPYPELIPLLYHLDDPALAFDYARSHLQSYCQNGIEKLRWQDAQCFMYWVKGVAITLHEYSPALISALENFQRKAVQNCQH